MRGEKKKKKEKREAQMVFLTWVDLFKHELVDPL